MTGVNDRAHRRRLNGLDLVLPDGQPVRWALNWIYGVGLRDRVLGPQLTLEAVEAAAKEHLSVYFYEGNKDTLHRFVKNLQHIFPQLIVAGPEPSKFRRLSQQEKQDVAERVEDSGARLSCSSAWAAHARKYGFMSTKTA